MQTGGRVTDALMTVVEAIVYAAEDSISADAIVEVIERVARGQDEPCDVTANQVHSALLELENRLRARGSGLQVLEIARGYRLGTCSALDPWIRAARQVDRPSQLSVPVLETLAVVAYRQPVTTAEVGAVRGKDPASSLRRLRELGLVRVTGRRRAVGRPFTYGTTDRFLELFGLRDLDELPSPEEFQELLEA